MKIEINGISGAVDEEALNTIFVKCRNPFSLTEQQAKTLMECFVFEYCDDIARLNDALYGVGNILDSYASQRQEVHNHGYAPF